MRRSSEIKQIVWGLRWQMKEFSHKNQCVTGRNSRTNEEFRRAERRQNLLDRVEKEREWRGVRPSGARIIRKKSVRSTICMQSMRDFSEFFSRTRAADARTRALGLRATPTRFPGARWRRPRLGRGVGERVRRNRPIRFGSVHIATNRYGTSKTSVMFAGFNVSSASPQAYTFPSLSNMKLFPYIRAKCKS